MFGDRFPSPIALRDQQPLGFIFMEVDVSKLFSPVTIGSISLKHRVVMPPLTRLRSNPDDSVSDMMVEHYAQRASHGGLIIIESANVSIQARGYLGAPGLYLDSHIDGYRRIADAIHAKGGRAVAQIVHTGRTSHVELTGGRAPIGPSVIPFNGMALTPDGWKPASPHRAMDLEDIRQTAKDFRDAAQRAFDAGVDGVEIHSANGYLLDSFLYDGQLVASFVAVRHCRIPVAFKNLRSRMDSCEKWRLSGCSTGYFRQECELT
jgi:N-ethylmaleimide reductase